MDLRRYDLDENEPLEGRQMVTIREQGNGRVVWTKTRELVDDEIVSTIFDSLHHPRWTISRPIRGWYLTLQRVTPDEKCEPYIELTPRKIRRAGPRGLELDFRLNGRRPQSCATNGEASPPPRSPTVRVNMSSNSHALLASSAMSPSLSNASTASASTSATPLNNPSSSPTTHRRSRSSISSPAGAALSLPSASPTYRLQPSFPRGFNAHAAGQNSFFERLRHWVVEPPRRFCCVRLRENGTPAIDGDEGEVVMAFDETPTGCVELSLGGSLSLALSFVLTCRCSFILIDMCSYFRPRLRGTLFLTPALVDASGYEPSFYAALACAYADVMEEQDGWEAAKGGD
ncbi:hypothetical protein JCM3770_004779 [Rhodotorula araucariae]